MVNPEWADLDQGLFSISVAAELAGLHPQTLRIYEREGLLDPVRSAGGTRRYSRNDITRLHEICTLTGDGLNVAGIRRVLELQEETQRLKAELARLKHASRGQPWLTGPGQASIFWIACRVTPISRAMSAWEKPSAVRLRIRSRRWACSCCASRKCSSACARTSLRRRNVSWWASDSGYLAMSPV